MNKYSDFSRQREEKKELIKYRMCAKKKAFESPESAHQKGQSFYACPLCGKYHRTSNFANYEATWAER